MDSINSPDTNAAAAGKKSSLPRNVEGEVRQTRRRRSTEEKRRRIRHSAFRKFADSGYFPTTVDAICEGAGISKGSFYWHYESKQAVFLDILDSWAHEVESELAENFRSALSSSGALTEFASAVEREANRCRRIIPVWLDFLSQVGRDTAIRDGLATFHRRIRRAIERLIEPVVTPALGKDATPAITGTILGAFIGLLCQDVTGDEDAEFAQQVRGFLALTEQLINNAAMAQALESAD